MWQKAPSVPQVKKLLEEIVTDCESDTISAELKSKIKQCYDIVSAQEEFIEGAIPPESPMLLKVVAATKADPQTNERSRMLSGHIVGQVLKTVAEMVKAKHCLEIGTFTGYSAIALAESAFCESVISLDNNESCKEFVGKMIYKTALQDKIQVRIGPASNSLRDLIHEKRQFDLVFIDADKISYADYYNLIVDNQLLPPNGVILCDNIMFANDVVLWKKGASGKALYDFVQMVKKDSRVDQLILPYRDGVMLIKLKAV